PPPPSRLLQPAGLQPAGLQPAGLQPAGLQPVPSRAQSAWVQPAGSVLTALRIGHARRHSRATPREESKPAPRDMKRAIARPARAPRLLRRDCFGARSLLFRA